MLRQVRRPGVADGHRAVAAAAAAWPWACPRCWTAAQHHAPLARRRSMPYSFSISMTPAGVQGRNTGSPIISRPTLIGMEAVHVLVRVDGVAAPASSSRCPRAGAAGTRMPSTAGSPLSSSDQLQQLLPGWCRRAGRTPSSKMPHSAQSFSLAGDIDPGGRVVPHQDHRQPGPPGQGFRLLPPPAPCTLAARALPSMRVAIVLFLRLRPSSGSLAAGAAAGASCPGGTVSPTAAAEASASARPAAAAAAFATWFTSRSSRECFLILML